MNKKETDFILKTGEGTNIEFKEGISGIEKDIVAFANTEGGRIFLGINDKNEIEGFELSNKIKSEILNIARNCDPSIQININKHGNIAIIEVKESENKPHKCSEGFYLRQGPTSQKLKVDEIRELFNKQGQILFEEMANYSFTMKDFDKIKFNSFLSKARISKNLPMHDILRNLSLVDERGHFKNAAILFFGKSIERFIPQGIITCVLYKGKDKVFIIDKKDFSEDISSNYENAMKFLYRNLRLEYIIEGSGPRKEVLEVPEKALKEALVNAIAHRDYFEKGAAIQIDVFDDRVEISNPGGLIFKEEEFGTRSLSRNPLIFGLLQRLDLVERVGSGIFRIREAMRKQGLKRPTFSFSTFFTTTLYKSGKENAPEMSQKSTRKVPEKYQKILDELIKKPYISRIELAKKLNEEPTAIQSKLRKLAKDGLIRRIGPDKGGHWEVVK